MSGCTGFIPARLGSTRFPGKVLADRTGRPLIQHVYESARGARTLSRVVVAADDRRVLDAARAFGAEAVMTGAHHPNGTSRIAEAAALLGLAPDHLVVNLQGDEPELDPGAVDAAVAALLEAEAGTGAVMGTVASRMEPGEDPDNPSVVKVVRDRRGCALYFSRARIPLERDAAAKSEAASKPTCLRHVGVYIYRRAFLDTYLSLPPTPLEQAEQLEQLRVLEHGYRIAVAVHPTRHSGIDTPEQYEAFVARWNAAHR